MKEENIDALFWGLLIVLCGLGLWKASDLALDLYHFLSAHLQWIP